MEDLEGSFPQKNIMLTGYSQVFCSDLVKPGSVLQLVRISYIMRVVMSSSPDWSENFLIFHITYNSCSKWFGARYNQEVRFSSAVKCKKGPQILNIPA